MGANKSNCNLISDEYQNAEWGHILDNIINIYNQKISSLKHAGLVCKMAGNLMNE